MRIDHAADRSMLETFRDRAGRRGPWLKLLSKVLDLGGPDVEFLRHSERPWNSATFCGARHMIAMTFTGTEAVACGEQLIAALPDHAFTIPGFLMADATIASVEHENGPQPRMSVEAKLLLLEDC
jgi:hypothetical protein